MLDWLQQKIGQRSNHPMNSPAEAAKLLAELPLDEPLKAVEEVAAWLESLAQATSSSTGSRLKVISMVDQAGHPCAEILMKDYLAGEARHAASRVQQWQALMDFWERLAGAYQLIALQIEVSKRGELAEQAALVAVRGMRAVSMQIRLGLMHYSGDTGRLWRTFYHLYAMSHAQRRAAVPLRPYPWDTLPTTARLELVRAVMLEIAAPHSLPPREIELTARIAAQLASSFAYGETPEKGLPLYLDLAQPRAPGTAPRALQAIASMRFFGPGAAPGRLKQMLDSIRAPQPATADRLGEEFTTAEKVETVRRLMLYWSDNPPRRKYKRARLSNKVDVMFGLGAIKRLVGKAGQPVSQEETDKIGIDRDADEAKEAAPEASTIETWKLTDISMRGLGAVTTHLPHGALQIGALMAFRLEGAGKWCVGIVRRLQSDTQNNSHVGAEILSKDPQLLWMNKLGMTQDANWSWDKGDQKSLQHLSQAVLLPSGTKVSGDDSLLFEPDSCEPEAVFDTMAGNRPRRLKLGAVIERGDDFERVAFSWLAAEAPAPKPPPTPPSAQGKGFTDENRD